MNEGNLEVDTPHEGLDSPGEDDTDSWAEAQREVRARAGRAGRRVPPGGRPGAAERRGRGLRGCGLAMRAQ